MTAVKLSGLTVELGGQSVLRELELELERGEHLLVVGPSGCGKSTLLRVIAGLQVPTRGSVELFGEPASSAGRVLVPPERRGVGFLFQGAALWPHLSVRRTLEFVLKRRGPAHSSRAGRRARVAELLDQVELTGFERRMPGTLSGGEAQRLALARALAAEPRLLLLDEPLGPLDRELRQALLERLAELRDQLGWTALHVTHDPAEAASVATRAVRFRDGQLREESLA